VRFISVQSCVLLSVMNALVDNSSVIEHIRGHAVQMKRMSLDDANARRYLDPVCGTCCSAVLLISSEMHAKSPSPFIQDALKQA
jgi:hypothetical protein